MSDLLYPELSYELVGLCFQVYNEISYGYQEKYYQRAFEILLNSRKISYKREQRCVLRFQGRIIGRYFIDFVIDNKIVIEFKVADEFYHIHFKQVLGYLKATSLRLGILVLISSDGLKYKRLVN